MRHVRPASIVHHHIAVDRIATTVAQLDGLRHAARQGVEVEDTARCWSGPHMVHGPLYLGHALLRMGDIDRARRHFGLCFDAGLPEAALALAGTYDPGILGKANRHHADAGLAELWYRQWHRLSVEHGAISPAISLHQLIDTLTQD